MLKRPSFLLAGASLALGLLSTQPALAEPVPLEPTRVILPPKAADPVWAVAQYLNGILFVTVPTTQPIVVRPAIQ